MISEIEQKNYKRETLAVRLRVPSVLLSFNHEPRPVIAHTYQISVKSNNPRRSYYDLNMSNLGAVHHLGFE